MLQCAAVCCSVLLTVDDSTKSMTFFLSLLSSLLFLLFLHLRLSFFLFLSLILFLSYASKHSEINLFCISLTHTQHVNLTQQHQYTLATTHNSLQRCTTLQHTATTSNILQHTATHCNTLQHQYTLATTRNSLQRCNTLQHTATTSNTLQHTATHCNTSTH